MRLGPCLSRLIFKLLLWSGESGPRCQHAFPRSRRLLQANADGKEQSLLQQLRQKGRDALHGLVRKAV